MRLGGNMNWILVVFDGNWSNRMEYKCFESIVEAFTVGNQLVKSKGNAFVKYRVEPFTN